MIRLSNRRRISRVAALLAAVALVPATAAAGGGGAEARTLYAEHCASCHGADRLGGMGPALLPQSLSRLKRAAAARSIVRGRAATQMPGFADKLTGEQVQVLVDYIYSPPEVTPTWDEADIRASRVVHYDAASLGDTPVFDADPMNLFIVVELGDHHATVLDGGTFEPIHRFPTRYALHGGPKFSPDGRYVYLISRDGWISKFDSYNLKTVAEIRVGINTRNAALSADGRYLIAGNYLPHTVVMLSAKDLSLLQVIPVTGEQGKSSRVSAVYTAPPRHSFIVALKDFPELWEIPYDDQAAAMPVYRGIMHDYRRESGEAPPLDERRFPIRRVKLDGYLDDFFFDQGYRHVIGASRGGGGQVVNLTVGQTVAHLDIPGMPHLGSGITLEYQGRDVVATPNFREGVISVIDPRDWSIIKRIKTLGPGFFLRSHADTPYLWADVFFGPNRDAIHVLDKQTLEIVRTLRPAPGKTSGHVEFTRDGRYALVSIWDRDGAVVVYDARTLEEVKRIPMNKPSGKYNVYNKTHYVRGTSH